MTDSVKPLLRLIVAAVPRVNIFSGMAKNTTDAGSAMLATAVANNIPGWRVEITQENDYCGPRDKNGLPDHKALQEEDPATAVGFCCGLSCSMERVWSLAEFYKSQGVVTLAGGKHAHYCPEETLQHFVDLVVHGDGEYMLGKILGNISAGLPLWKNVTGCSFLFSGRVCHNGMTAETILQIPDMDKTLVCLSNEMQDLDALSINHGFIKHADKLRYVPLSMKRGCRYACEFCSVNDKPRSASGKHAFAILDWLVVNMGARRFFIVDDLFEENLPETMEFLRLIKEKYGRKLILTVQVRLKSAENVQFVQAMFDAGVRTLCVGYESPSDRDLKAMRKGITSAKMLEWTEIYGKRFWLHAMMIFGYPPKAGEQSTGVQELLTCFKNFIQKAVQLCPYGFTIQILKPIPVVGSDLRRRLQSAGLIFPSEIIPWRYYDGNWACFMPQNMTLRELQETPTKIMDWFYGQFTLFGIFKKVLRLPLDILAYGWNDCRRRLHKELAGYAASRMMQRWHSQTDFEAEALLETLQNYWENRER